MLSRLSIENYILIDSLDLELSPSLNIITGETGAGKSILLGALGLLLGNRSESGCLRDVSRNCVIEGIFNPDPEIHTRFFQENDLDYLPQTVVRRIITPAGKSRAYINDIPVQQAVLKEFGSLMIDIHSQHQNLLLSDDGFRISLVDSVAGITGQVEIYKKHYKNLIGLRGELTQTERHLTDNQSEREWLEHQVAELTAALLKEGEFAELEALFNELDHTGEIHQTLALCADILGNEDSGLNIKLKEAEQALIAAGGFHPTSQTLSHRIRATREELKDVEREINSELSRLDTDPAKLEQVRMRLDALNGLIFKHKARDEKQLHEIFATYKHRLGTLDNGQERLDAIRKAIGVAERETLETAKAISAGRTDAAAKISKSVTAMLAKLGMETARFSVVVSPAEKLLPSGADVVEYLLAPDNKGEMRPVQKIASGGETSRVMLALKSLAAATGNLPTVIFDEIDTGVSGRIADAMGDIITELASKIQIVNITHLPQVAAKGQTHFVVRKTSGAEGPVTSIEKITGEERIVEIAKMLSGSTVTEAAIRQARILTGMAG